MTILASLPRSPRILAAALCFLPLACRDQTPEVDRSDRPVIALVMKSLANEFFKTMAEGAEAHHADNATRYDLIVNGIRNETDLGAQVNLVEQMVSVGVDAIVIAPADSKALIPVLKRAHEAGVLIINIDNQLDAGVLAQTGLVAPFVGPDNREGARKVGGVVAEQLDRGDAVAIIEGVPSAFNGIQRRLGFEDAMREAGLRVVTTQSGSWEMERANQVAAAILSEHEEIKAILCANDSMALGTVAAVRAAGLEGNVLVAGFDNISAVRPLIENGRLLATADQHGDQLAVFGIEAALSILSAAEAPANKQTVVDLITRTSLLQ